jgi:hypothetical protein
MASLSWKKLIPNLEVLDTKKKYFGQYLYRLELLAYGGRSINAQADVVDAIHQRISSYRHVNYGGSWQAQVSWQLQQANFEWLEYLKSQKFNLVPTLKIRVEEPKVQVYSENETDLLDFVRQIPQEFRQYGISIHCPANDEQRAMLNAGIKIVKNVPAYRYKINFRDGKYTPETKHHILTYLTNLGDIVKVSTPCREKLSKSDFGYVWDAYVYTNDINITTFMQIIHPNLIRSIIEMAAVEQVNTDNKEF